MKYFVCRIAALSVLALFLFNAPFNTLLGSTAAQSGRMKTPPSAVPTPTPKPTDKPPINQAPQTPETADEAGVIRVETSLVTIPVSVLDRTGRYVPFMNKRDFRVYEDGVEQEIERLEPVTVPFHVVLMIDTSRSTVFDLKDIQTAAIAFIDQLRPDDRVMVVSFDEEVYIDSEFTSDRERLRRAIRRTRTGGGTKLYDAVDLVLTERLDRIEGRKAIVLFTDGVDTTSRRAGARSTVAQVEESGALVYPIKYNTEGQFSGGRGQPPIWTNPWPQPPPRRRRPFDPLINRQFPQGRYPRGSSGDEYRLAAQYLNDLANRSGGRLFNADTLGNVNQAFTSIAEELRQQYALSYYPTNATRDGSYRKVKVRVQQPNLVVRAREGYRAVPDHQPRDAKDEERPRFKRNLAIN